MVGYWTEGNRVWKWCRDGLTKRLVEWKLINYNCQINALVKNGRETTKTVRCLKVNDQVYDILFSGECLLFIIFAMYWIMSWI